MPDEVSYIDTVGADYMIEDYNISKDKYVDWIGGPFWNSNLTLNQFVDALMHLLFLGVTTKNYELVMKWIHMSKRMKVFSFVKEGILQLISVMGLDWCKLQDASLGWVSENYVAFAIIIK